MGGSLLRISVETATTNSSDAFSPPPVPEVFYSGKMRVKNMEKEKCVYVEELFRSFNQKVLNVLKKINPKIF